MTELASSRFLSLLLLVLHGLLSGCAPATSPVVWQEPATDWVYPEPPKQARIRYLRSISDIKDIREKRSGQRLINWLGGEQPIEAPIVAPYAVAADGEGRIWLTNPGTGLLYFVDLPHQQIEFFSLLAGRRLSSPTGLAYDSAHKRLYIANAGSLEILVVDENHDFLLSLKPPGGFQRPAGLALDTAGNLYVADALKGTIEVFSVGGRYLRSLGSRLNSDGKFNHPSNLAIDAEGRVYVVDSFNFRVEILGLAGEPPTAIGGLGTVAGSFARPRGIALDSAGHVYVSDAAFDNIQVFNRDGELLLVFGQPGQGPDSFCLPAGLTFDRADRLYVADNCGHQVKIFQFLAE